MLYHQHRQTANSIWRSFFRRIRYRFRLAQIRWRTVLLVFFFVLILSIWIFGFFQLTSWNKMIGLSNAQLLPNTKSLHNVKSISQSQTLLGARTAKASQFNRSHSMFLNLAQTYFESPAKNPAILVLTYNRPDYLGRVLSRLNGLPRRNLFQVYVSQDGDDSATTTTIADHSEWVQHLKRKRDPEIDSGQGPTAYLAQHYRWALDQVFTEKQHSHVVVLEDDLFLSQDALIMFEQTAHLLDVDPSIWCVSSWNDLGTRQYAHNNTLFFRTDFFPGLGWMLRKELWQELSKTFPRDHWDHWMRLDTVSKGRSCIAPQISRNQNIGAVGSTVSDSFFAQYINQIAFSEETVLDFGDLSYLLEPRYDEFIAQTIATGKLYNHSDGSLSDVLASAPDSSNRSTLIAAYYLEDFRSLVSFDLNVLPAPRTTYKGIIKLQVRENQHLILVDKRISPFCPNSLRFTVHSGLTIVAASQDGLVDCNSACTSFLPSYRCARDHFQLINKCSSLMNSFPCTRGCIGGVIGDDVPNFVSDSSKADMAGFCLTSEDWPTCESRHWSTSRLCPCTPS